MADSTALALEALSDLRVPLRRSLAGGGVPAVAGNPADDRNAVAGPAR